MNKLLKFLSQKYYVLPLIIIYLFFSLYLFPQSYKNIDQIAGQELRTLDLRISYSKNDVLNLFTSMKPQGRAIYKKLEQTTDAVYPIIYGLLLMGLFAYSIRKKPLNKKNSYFVFLPIIVVILDFIENMRIIHLLESYPHLSKTYIITTSLVTGIKNIGLGLIVIYIIFLLIKNIRKE